MPRARATISRVRRGSVLALALAGCSSLYGVTPLTGGSDAAAAGSADDAILYYPLDRLLAGSNCVADASAAHAHPGICIDGLEAPGVTANGHHGSAFMFDGSAGFVVPTDGNLANMPTFSVTAWIQIQLPATGCPLSRPDGAGSGGDEWQLCVESSPDTIGVFNELGFGSSAYVRIAENFDSGWHHIALTWDGSNEVLYFNGSPRVTLPALPASASSELLSFGIDLDGAFATGSDPDPQAGFEGALDDVRVYQRVLLGPEIASLAEEQ
jgi:hypothetical protein